MIDAKEAAALAEQTRKIVYAADFESLLSHIKAAAGKGLNRLEWKLMSKHSSRDHHKYVDIWAREKGFSVSNMYQPEHGDDYVVITW